MTDCERLKLYLAKHGKSPAQRHQALQAHLEDCADCRRLARAWDRIPGLLDELPEYEPDEELLERVLGPAKAIEPHPGREFHRAPRLAISLGSAAVLVAAIGLSLQLFRSEYPPPLRPELKESFEPACQEMPMKPSAGPGSVDDIRGADPVGGQYAGESRGYGDDAGEAAARNGRGDSGSPEEEWSSGYARQAPAKSPSSQAGAHSGDGEESRDIAAGTVPIIESMANQVPAGRESQRRNKQDQYDEGRVQDRARRDSFTDGDGRNRALPGNESLDRLAAAEAIVPTGSMEEYRKTSRELTENRLSVDGKLKEKRPGTRSESDFLGLEPDAGLKAELNSEFGGRARWFGYDQAGEALHFQPASGYWANTHVPGDPAIRLLRARLAAWDRTALGTLSGLEQDVRPVAQPFDAPADNALALNLMSDANAVDGPTRMRLQVGIRAIEHRRGQRPAMNVGVVMDLPADADVDSRIAARALLDAVLASKQPGDRFSLVFSGAGGLAIPPEDFRFGPLQLARRAIAGEDLPVTAQNRDLQAAIARAGELVRQTDDPSLPLGSSSILLISATSLEEAGRLEPQVHALAGEGVTTSVVPLGSRPKNSAVERLVLAGLGNRRVLEAPGQAQQLVETELHSSSRAVARAARLSIRLAPGVRLIDVVGSKRLDAEMSQRVRDIEGSMDRRLSTNLGIQADRGKDEEGIQIVIPSIFSGDDVTVLLDVLADGAGEVASVSLRYKDLVYLRNGKLQGQLSLPAGTLQRGPAQHAVLKSLLVHQFSEAAGRAADALGGGNPAEASAILAGLREEIIFMINLVPEFKHDQDLQRDLQVLERYISVLASPAAHQPELADSLRYAAWAKAHRPPLEWKL